MAEWFNGFFTGTLVLGLMILGRGLWYHDSTWMVTGSIVGAFSLLFWLISAEEAF